LPGPEDTASIHGAPEVAVTGLGAVSAAGIGARELWDGLLAGKPLCRPAPPSARGIPLPGEAGVLGEISARIDDIVAPRFLRRVSTITRYSLGAAALALKEAAGPGLPPGRLDDTAVLLGTSYGSAEYHFEYYERLFRNGIKDASPLLFSESVMNAAPGHLSIVLGLRGPTLAVMGGEEAGLAAIADGIDRLRLREAGAALAGGAEEYCDFVHAALAGRGIVSGERAQPFSGAERGSFLGEGAAVLVLERAEDARSRGAPILALAAGCGFARGFDGGEAGSRAVEAAIRSALRDARCAPEDVDLVVSSARGGALDADEASGIERALGTARSDPRWIIAPKAVLGEGFAFTSAVEALVAVKAIAEGVVPPGPGGPAPGAPRGMVFPASPVEARIGRALAVSLNLKKAAVAVVFEAPRS